MNRRNSWRKSTTKKQRKLGLSWGEIEKRVKKQSRRPNRSKPRNVDKIGRKTSIRIATKIIKWDRLDIYGEEG